ncbi:MAG: multidrug efflux pump subunit, partial [Gammaproteobacteria bacterium]|nr:multidrug efflux pump subunit [Gammaproteobacteria bacterium]
AASLRAFPIALPNGNHLRLDQVAEVTDTVTERSQAALLDGEPVVGFQIFRAKGYDEVSVSAGVHEAVERLISEHEGLKITQVATTVDFTKEQFRGSMHMLYEGALLAILVVWWFLRDARHAGGSHCAAFVHNPDFRGDELVRLFAEYHHLTVTGRSGRDTGR